ncbi:MAG: GNAT family N-acetyltransferase [Terriglobia bacterium]
MRITTKELRPDLWPALESLFGINGACGGCWCQAWRIEKGERWAEVKGAVAKARLRKGVRKRSMFGILAFVANKPVGWCTFGPRDSFPRLNRAPSLQCDDSTEVWSLPCFFVARGFRRKGVAGALLKPALTAMSRQGVRLAEGYPSKPDKAGRYIDTFAWTGTLSLFRKAGFTRVGNPTSSKQRVRKTLHRTWSALSQPKQKIQTSTSTGGAGKAAASARPHT